MKFLFAAIVPLALGGCAQPTTPTDSSPLIRAADPELTEAAPSGPAVIHTSRAIMEPADWRQLNDAQAPGGSS